MISNDKGRNIVNAITYHNVTLIDVNDNAPAFSQKSKCVEYSETNAKYFSVLELFLKLFFIICRKVTQEELARRPRLANTLPRSVKYLDLFSAKNIQF